MFSWPTSGADGLGLYRLFNKATGDGIVDATYIGQFRSSFNAGVGNPLYLSYLDANNDGVVDTTDLGHLRTLFNAYVV